MTSTERDGFFRGSEFPRLLLLLAVAVAGWMVFVYYANRPERRTSPRPPTVGQLAPLPPPDDSPEFRGLRDKTKLGRNDLAAYAELWRRVGSKPPEDLAEIARRDVFYSQLFEDPGRYRGLPIHLEGTVRRVLSHDDADARVIPGRRMYEAFLFTPDSQNNPIILVFKDPPGTLPIGDNLFARVSFDGYFLKQMTFIGGDNRGYFAPLLIGRLYHFPEADAEENPGTRNLFWTLSPLFVLFLYAVVRWAFHLRRALAPHRPPPIKRGPLPSDEIDPEALAAWAEAPDDADEPPPYSDEGPDEPREGDAR